MTTKEEIRRELAEVLLGLKEVFFSEFAQREPAEFKKHGLPKPALDGPIHQAYQNYYTRALGLMRSLAPDRYSEFVACYEPDPKRKIVSPRTFAIRDYLTGLSYGDGKTITSFANLIQLQIALVEAVLTTLDKRIVSIEAVLQASLFDHEIDVAQELLSKGHLRAAGAVAGVVLESHLNVYSKSKSIVQRKKAPSVADYNDALKEAGAIDVPRWRAIQRLGDIRNLCVHAKDREPTRDEVQDLVIGTKKTITELL